MKISLNWLTDYVDVAGRKASDLAAVFTRIGLCCDAVAESDSDVVFDLEVTSNRPDCLGHIGAARELAAALGLAMKLPDLSKVPTDSQPRATVPHGKDSQPRVPTGVGMPHLVEVLDPDLCPRYTARLLRNVKVGPSPRWMVERLEAVGMRSINNVVDVTNYVLMEYSQPLHSFDFDKLAGRRIVVRRGRAGESIVSIDGTRCPLTADMLVIADAEKPVAIAGIMGGLESEIGPATTNILLESAQFDPLTTRRTARALSLMTESSYRFERGVDPVGLERASLRACQLILQTGGGELAEGIADVWAKPYVAPAVALRTDRCRMLLATDVDDATQQGVLDRLGLQPRREAGRIVCTIPAHRPDLTREVDLIEEIARLVGLDKIPTRDRVTHPVTGTSPTEGARRAVREALLAGGFDEAITLGFVDDAEAALFGFDKPVRVDPQVRRSNNLLRPTLLASLARAQKTNQDAGNEDVSLYEIAAVFPPSGSDLPDEHVDVGLVSQRDVRALRGVLEAMAQAVSTSGKLEVHPAPVPGLAEGASAKVLLGGREIGCLGMLAQPVLDYYGLEKPLAAASVQLEPLLVLAQAGHRVYHATPRFPPIRRDLSVVVDEAVSWAALDSAVRSANQPALEQVQYVGAYRGKQVPPGRKSVTLSLTFRLADSTLRHEQADEMVAAVVAKLKQKLQAELRG